MSLKNFITKYRYIYNFFAGLSTGFGNLPQIHILFSLLWRFCIICTQLGKKILHETIFSLRLDACGSLNRCNSVLSHYSKYIRRIDMVHCAGFDDHLQRHHGLRFWFLLWKNASHKIIAEENLGRIYWRRDIDCHFWIYGKTSIVIC